MEINSANFKKVYQVEENLLEIKQSGLLTTSIPTDVPP